MENKKYDMENEILNHEKLENFYDNFIYRCKNDYWREIIIEHILQNFTEEQINDMKLTHNKINDMITEILCDDSMWEEIDYTLADVVGKNIKGE